MVNEETKEAEQDNTADSARARGKSEKPSFVEQVDAATARLEAANRRSEELLNEQKELFARQRIGGESSGSVEPTRREETPQEYAQRMLTNRLTDEEKQRLRAG